MASGGPPAIQIGDLVLERYRVDAPIATGGHSLVYRGTDERLQRPVCIKVFSGLGGESGLGRTSYEHFVQEAFALSRLTHPSTLRIFDFGHLGTADAPGMPVQVCEYMNGGTLSQIVREQGPRPIAETAQLLTAMCAALGEAHSLGIVHRDIKPQNILFAAVGATRLPKLADFGIAKWSADDEDRPSRRAEDTAVVAGQKLAMYSPSWAAPEQLAGQPVSPATDLYSLAAVAVYMLTARAVFADEDVYAGYKKRRHGDELVRAALAARDVPGALIEVLLHALAFDPKRRPGRVEELAAELATALEPITDEQIRLPAATEESPIIAPTPPVLPAIGRTPTPAPTWGPAPVVPPWMAIATAPPASAPVWLPLAETPQTVAERRVHFVMLTQAPAADLVGRAQQKVRVSLMPVAAGRVLHLKGLTCFVAPLGGRPSPAINVDHDADVALVTPRAQEIGHLRISHGAPGAGHAVFAIGEARVAVSAEDCADPILFDFGPGSDAYFVYTRGRAAPRVRR